MSDKVTQPLAGLVMLERRVRACDSPEALGWLMVNDIHQLVPYRQAAFWRADNGRVQALSGLATPDRNAPFVVWLASWMAAQEKLQPGAASRVISVSQVDAADVAMWREHLPAHGLWLALRGTDGKLAGVLAFWRDQPWRQADIVLLETLADACAHAWLALTRSGKGKVVRTGNRRLWWAASALAVLLLLLPVRQSVLAPAEVVANAPVMVRAPLQGVVDEILVQPNQEVKAGQLLLKLDARELESQLETARQTFAVAAAELRQGQQQALLDVRGKAMLGLLQGKQEQAAADVAYLTEALERSQVHATRDGIVIFDDVNDWVGRPVALGERIMMLADPQDAQLEVMLPVADAIDLHKGAQVRFFLNIAPTAPLDGVLERMGYRASQTPDGVMAYRVRARFEDGVTLPRIGLKGTAKLYGERTILFLYLMRRPLASLRAWLGW